LLLSPAQVQGDGAAESIVAALEALQYDERVEVIILARGGGAADDLSAFNDERVARAVFASRAPVVTGVGHATDRTLVEDVADASAATPSVAAEISVPSMVELAEQVAWLHERLGRAFAACHAETVAPARLTLQRLRAVSPTAALRTGNLAIERSSRRLHEAARERIADRRQEVSAASALLAAIDPAAVLKRGYAALQTADDGQPVFSVSQVREGANIVAILEDGAVRGTAQEVVARPPLSGRVAR
jgi:exodeoxyribonuclease VII large subunit